MEASEITKKRIAEYLSSGKRFDNRELLEYRDIVIETGISKNAEGSARVKFGETEVLAGVKLDFSAPYTDSEEEGTFMTTVELLPLSSERFEPGPPRIEAIELARVVDRGIRESGFIDFKKLCIKKGEKVWTVFLDIYSINDAGNLLDAAALAAITALKDAKMPVYDEKLERVKYGEWTKNKLPLGKSMPFTMTFHQVNDTVILDPAREEEDAADLRLSIAVSSDEDGKPAINAMQLGKDAGLKIENAEKIIEMAEKKFKEIYPKIEEMIEKAVKAGKK